MRPVFYDYPELMKAPCDHSMAFAVGRDLLIAPSRKPESTNTYGRDGGSGWFDYWTGLEVEGETKPDAPFEVVKEVPALDRLPIFIRAGAIIPKQAVTQSTSEKPEGPSNCTSIPAPIAEVKFTGTMASAFAAIACSRRCDAPSARMD